MAKKTQTQQKTLPADRSPASPLDDLIQVQRDYCRKLEDNNFDFGLVVGKAFVRGIRDIGYKSTGTALNELIDNSIQAGAENVHVLLGFSGGSDKKPTHIAVIDDGHGMVPTMIRAAVLWGGTHRENDREGFGRYGYGLPSACVSQGRRFAVYSCPLDGEWHKVTLDLDAIQEGKLSRSDGRIVVLPAVPTELPEWVRAYIDEQLEEGRFNGDGKQGTVVVIDLLDHLTYKTESRLHRHLMETFGVTYREILDEESQPIGGRKALEGKVRLGYAVFQLTGAIPATRRSMSCSLA